MSIEVRVRLFKDPVSSTTHFAGFWLALGAAVLLVSRAAGDLPRTTGMAIYGASLAGLFLSSSCYHFLDLGSRGNRWLRRLDHSAIFFLIAGTAVPPLLLVLEGTGRLAVLAVVLGLAVAGALLKVLWIDCPGWLGMGLYLGLSAAVLVPGHRILPQLSGGALAWLVGGGLAYLLGALIYARRWPDPWPGRFGHHEIWHLFVLVGAGSHYAFTWSLLGLLAREPGVAHQLRLDGGVPEREHPLQQLVADLGFQPSRQVGALDQRLVPAHQRAVGAGDALELREAEARRRDQRGDGGSRELRIGLLAHARQEGFDLRVVDRAGRREPGRERLEPGGRLLMLRVE